MERGEDNDCRRVNRETYCDENVSDEIMRSQTENKWIKSCFVR